MTQKFDLQVTGPHQKIAADHPRHRFTLELLDRLWDVYRNRVSYVQTYEQVIGRHNATFVNDHIALRTIANQNPQTGIASISRLIEALDYRPAGAYYFPDKHLNAIHFQHPHPEFPKIFVSELKTWELSPTACEIIGRSLQSHRDPIDVEILAALAALDDDAATNRVELMKAAVNCFHELPFNPPEKNDVETIGQESQYAAWVLVHGYNVNHFTSLINSHGVESLDDIEKTIAALQEAGVPMKKSVEGERGSKLRQSATEAVHIDVDVMDGGKPAQMKWTYAYLELAQRGEVTDPETGRSARFEGFLGPQATHLFEMTRIS